MPDPEPDTDHAAPVVADATAPAPDGVPAAADTGIADTAAADTADTGVVAEPDVAGTDGDLDAGPDDTAPDDTAPDDTETDDDEPDDADVDDGPADEPEEATYDDALLALGAAVTEPDAAAEDAARTRLGGDEVTSYGRLGELALWWASVRGPAPGSGPATAPRRVLLAGGGTDVAARRPGVRALGLPRGGTVDDALAWGIEQANRAADDGTDLVLLTVEDTAPWRALAADLMAMDAVEASGWPADRGMTDERWMDDVVALRDRLRQLRGLRTQPVELLRALGSPTVAAAAALLTTATARRTPVLLDGPGAGAVALLAVRLNYAAPRWWQAAHRGDDVLHERMLGSVGLDPVTRLDVRRSDGTAALAGLALLDAAVALLTDDDPEDDQDDVPVALAGDLAGGPGRAG